jgi:hypothetical protein
VRQTAPSAAGPEFSRSSLLIEWYFSWDMSPHWQIETDPRRTSEVEVRFAAETPERTRLELEHRHLDRHGAGWEGVRDGVDDDAGWPLHLARYADLLTAERETLM